MTPRDVLLAAADHIEAHGWVQGKWGHKGEPCCAEGAIVAVLDGNGGIVFGELGPLSAAAKQMLRNALGKAIPAWNDAPGRTAAEVVAALREAARKAADIIESKEP